MFLRTLCWIFGLFLAMPTIAMSQEHRAIVDSLKARYLEFKDFDRFAVGYQIHLDAKWQSFDFNQPDRLINHHYTEIDRQRGQFYDHFKRTNPGNFVFEFITSIKDSKAYRYDVNGFVYGKALRKFDSSVEQEMEYLTELLDFLNVASLLSDDKLKLKVDILGQIVQIQFADSDGHDVVYHFDKDTLRLLSIDFHEDDSRQVYSQYISGFDFSYASRVDIYESGKLTDSITIEQLNKITRIDPKKLAIPNGYQLIETPTDEALEIVPIGKNLYLIEDLLGSRNILTYRRNDGLTVFGAPGNNEASKQVLALLKKQFPNEVVTHVYVSHAHSDHFNGLGVYIDKGVSIIADDHTAEAITRYDRFAKYRGQLAFQLIGHHQMFQNVRYFVLENSHVRKQSFVLFEGDGIIYQGDFLEIPRDNSIASHMSDVERLFIEYLLQNNISYKRIVGHHRNSDIKPAIVRAYYDNNK